MWRGIFLMDKGSHGIIFIKINSDGCGGGYSSWIRIARG
jgi:hypothetical protein